MIIFNRTFDGESLVDIEEAVWDAVNENYNLPRDKHNLLKGTFTVTISWEND